MNIKPTAWLVASTFAVTGMAAYLFFDASPYERALQVLLFGVNCAYFPSALRDALRPNATYPER